jgi:hypothetical protein
MVLKDSGLECEVPAQRMVALKAEDSATGNETRSDG